MSRLERLMDPARAGKAVSAVGRARNLSNKRRVTMDVFAGGLVASLMRGSVLSEHKRRYLILVSTAVDLVQINTITPNATVIAGGQQLHQLQQQWPLCLDWKVFHDGIYEWHFKHVRGRRQRLHVWGG